MSELQAQLHDQRTDRKIITKLAGVVKNKNDPGWDCLPPVLRNPTVLYDARKGMAHWPVILVLGGCPMHLSFQYIVGNQACETHLYMGERVRACLLFSSGLLEN